MFISQLLVNVGSDPDRPRPGRLWLRNLYRVHQRLCMAFPSRERRQSDGEFLKPFLPDDFGEGHVHVERAAQSGFLYRIDTLAANRVVILVQSAVAPDWEYAFHNAGYLLDAPAQTKPFDPVFDKGQRLRFRLLANPTKKVHLPGPAARNGAGPEGRPDKNGRRVPVYCDRPRDPATGERPPMMERKQWLAHRDAKLREWLQAREWDGETDPAVRVFAVDADPLSITAGYVYFDKRNYPGQRGEAGAKDPGEPPPRELKGRMVSARYDGILAVTDPDRFARVLARGIGPAKAFGFGLLSVAPV